MSKPDGIEARYRKVAHMAVAYSNMLKELQHDVSMQLKIASPVLKGHDDDLAEMQECLIDGIMGLAGLVRADKREPFSA